MKRKETLKTRTKPKLNRRKYNFVTTWDPAFLDIRKALHKFTNVLMEDEECREVFLKGSFRVAYCMVLQEGTHFRSNVTGERFRIKQEINYRSKNIIYLVTCRACGKQGGRSNNSFSE